MAIRRHAFKNHVRDLDMINCIFKDTKTIYSHIYACIGGRLWVLFHRIFSQINAGKEMKWDPASLMQRTTPSIFEFETNVLFQLSALGLWVSIKVMRICKVCCCENFLKYLWWFTFAIATHTHSFVQISIFFTQPVTLCHRLSIFLCGRVICVCLCVRAKNCILVCVWQ